jgi:hypothetical protein
MTDARPAGVTVFMRLPPREQELVAMVAWEDWSLDEVADILDCSRTAVAMRLVRSRRRLAGLMRANCLETGDDDATTQQLFATHAAALTPPPSAFEFVDAHSLAIRDGGPTDADAGVPARSTDNAPAGTVDTAYVAALSLDPSLRSRRMSRSSG